jgi:hypothetical protein
LPEEDEVEQAASVVAARTVAPAAAASRDVRRTAWRYRAAFMAVNSSIGPAAHSGPRCFRTPLTLDGNDFQHQIQKA